MAGQVVDPAAAKQRVVSPAVARAVLWHLGDSWGVDPGSFDASLMRMIDRADEVNRARLEEVFPEYVVALRDGRKPWGIDWLRKVASEAVTS